MVSWVVRKGKYGFLPPPPLFFLADSYSLLAVTQVVHVLFIISTAEEAAW